MKKALALVLATGMLALLLAGCGGENVSTPVPTVDPHAGMVEVPDGLGGSDWVPDQEDMALNPYGSEDFLRDESGNYVNYIGTEATALQGVDVSFYQGEIDWNAVREAGISFAILRAGYRGWGEEGSLNPDETFAANLAGAKAAGLEVGVYFFSQAMDVQEAREEAAYVLELLGGTELELPVYFDWEHIATDEEARTHAVDTAMLTEISLAFCETVEAGGYEGGVYFYRSLGYWAYDLAALQDYDLWLAAVGDAPEFYYRFDMWQYSYTGQVPGIPADVDLNLRFVEPEPVPSPSPSPDPEMAQ